MGMIEDKANRIVDDTKSEMPTVFFDPITIIAVIGLIVQLIRLYQSCKKKPEDAKTLMAAPNFIHRWRLRRMVRAALAKEHSEETVCAVSNSVLKQGKLLTVDEVHKLYQEVEAK